MLLFSKLLTLFWSQQPVEIQGPQIKFLLRRSPKCSFLLFAITFLQNVWHYTLNGSEEELHLVRRGNLVPRQYTCVDNETRASQNQIELILHVIYTPMLLHNISILMQGRLLSDMFASTMALSFDHVSITVVVLSQSCTVYVYYTDPTYTQVQLTKYWITILTPKPCSVVLYYLTSWLNFNEIILCFHSVV